MTHLKQTVIAILVVAALCVGFGGCLEPVSMEPGLEQQFRDMNARVQMLGVKCDPCDPNVDTNGCIGGWSVFADDLQIFVDAMDGREPTE